MLLMWTCLNNRRSFQPRNVTNRRTAESRRWSDGMICILFRLEEKKKILKLFWSIIIAIVTHCVGFLMLFPRRFREIFRLDWCHCWCLFSDVEWGRKMCSKVSIGMLECRRLLFAFHTLATSSEWFIESGTIRVCWQRKDPLVRVFVIVSLSSLFRPKLSLLIFVYENSVTISGVVVCTSIFTQCCGCDSFFSCRTKNWDIKTAST